MIPFISCQHFFLPSGLRSVCLSLWTEPESVPGSGEQCKHPGLSSGPASPDRTRPPASTSASTFPLRFSKNTTILSLSASDWWHRRIPFMTAQCFWVTVTTRWKQSALGVLSFPTLITREELRKKKRRSNNEEVTVEVKQTVIAVISEDKRWEWFCWLFTAPVNAELTVWSSKQVMWEGPFPLDFSVHWSLSQQRP